MSDILKAIISGLAIAIISGAAIAYVKIHTLERYIDDVNHKVERSIDVMIEHMKDHGRHP